MSSTMTENVSATKTIPLYPFLSQPPPQKKRPTQPLPSPPSNGPSVGAAVPGRRRSVTTSAISTWIANVQPGSPAPYSPRRSPSSLSYRRPSLTRSSSRRPSVTSIRVSSSSFLNFSETPTTASRAIITPSVKEFSSSDLALVGYTSVFVHLPGTPLSARDTHQRRLPSPQVGKTPNAPQKSLKHFRSLGALRAPRRARSRSVIKPSSPIRAAKEIPSNATVIKNKKSKYAKFRPAPLATELALAQLMDGGKIDDHAVRFAYTEAKAAGAVKVDGQLVGVGGVYRDGEGGIWRDQDEELEYTHLLAVDEKNPNGWIRFGSEASKSPLSADDRRGSLSTQDSDLHPRFAMQIDSDVHDDLAAFAGALVPTIQIKPGMSILAIPARSRRTAKHLRKPELLLDVFPVPLSPRSPRSPTLVTATTSTLRSPKSPRFAFSNGRTIVRPCANGKVKRRPAPLTLTPPSPAFKCPTNPADVDAVRQDFLGDSFAPRPRRAAEHNRELKGYGIYEPAPQPEAVAPPKQNGLFSLFRAIGGKKNSGL
ncbi:hypothetical protein C8Q75DRAFT_245316 [Abortiporus biennis]|nr:hypothetical protein C8Q75DRAFT_245316 [Abortiporus biennis]